MRALFTSQHFSPQAYRDMDYVVKDKFFLERVLDMEFQELGDMSVLYNGNLLLSSGKPVLAKGNPPWSGGPSSCL